jgi:hypothetical protein
MNDDKLDIIIDQLRKILHIIDPPSYIPDIDSRIAKAAEPTTKTVVTRGRGGRLTNSHIKIPGKPSPALEELKQAVKKSTFMHSLREGIQGEQLDPEVYKKIVMEGEKKRLEEKYPSRPRPRPPELPSLPVSGLGTAPIKTAYDIYVVEKLNEYTKDYIREHGGSYPSDKDRKEFEQTLPQPGWRDKKEYNDKFLALKEQHAMMIKKYEEYKEHKERWIEGQLSEHFQEKGSSKSRRKRTKRVKPEKKSTKKKSTKKKSTKKKSTQ